MMPFIRIPLIIKTGSTEIQEKTKFVVTYMQVVDNLCFELAIYLRYSLQFNANLIINQEVIEEIMLQLHAMEYEINMLLTLVRNTVLFEQNLKSILIYLLFEATTHLTMQLHRNSEYFATQFLIDVCHSIV